MADRTTVDEFLASKNLTREEWELHRDLIEDCRKNEIRIMKNCAETKENIERMSAVIDMISAKMLDLSIALDGLIGEAEGIALRMLPEDRFCRE